MPSVRSRPPTGDSSDQIGLCTVKKRCAVSGPISLGPPVQQTKCTRSLGSCGWLCGALWFSLSTCGPQPSWLFPEGRRTPCKSHLYPRQDYPSSSLLHSIYASSAASFKQLWSALHVRVCNESPWNLPSVLLESASRSKGNQWAYPWGRSQARLPVLTPCGLQYRVTYWLKFQVSGSSKWCYNGVIYSFIWFRWGPVCLHENET